MQRLCVLLATACVLFFGRAEAAQGQNKAVYGFGRASCGAYLKVRANRNNHLDVSFLQALEWVDGFLTSYNVYLQRTDIKRSIDQEGIHAWLDKYCQANPTAMVVDAVVELIKHLDQGR